VLGLDAVTISRWSLKPLPFIPLGKAIPPDARAHVAPLRAINSSVVVASRSMLRDYDGFDAYLARLSPSARDALAATPAGIWMPVDLARAHFEACDALGLSEVARVEMARKIAARLHGPVFRVAFRLAGAAGATPLLLAAKSVKLWPERNQGGDILIVQTAPNQARVELLGYTLADIIFVRSLWRGTLEGNARLVMPRARVTELTAECTATKLVYAMSWGGA
jgi:hypothetical protein